MNPFRWFRRRAAEKPDQVKADRQERLQSVVTSLQRQFEGATTDRLKKTRWADAKGVPINVDLRANLTTLRDRCEYEIQNNGLLSGMVETFVTDVVGEEGPMLHLSTANAAYKAKLAKIWWDWWQKPEVTGLLSGAELLAEGIRGYWNAGEFLWHMVSDENATGAVRMRIATYHTRRLKSPPEQVGQRFVTYGILRTQQGRPVTYFVLDSDESDVFFVRYILIQTVNW